ncbi:MAG: protein kinase, partial [Anaerolineales bacterium]
MATIVGQTLAGRYHVEEEVGRGGMAVVYKVWDQERTVHLAMKLLQEDLAIDKVFLRRFKREAQTLAKLQHPNIVRLYGLEKEGRLAFMLMDFVDGASLKHEI